MKKYLTLMSLIIYTISITMCLYWYDWKLLLILFLFVTANNLETYIKSLK